MRPATGSVAAEAFSPGTDHGIVRVMMDVVDIKAKADFPAGALSNFAPHAFTFDGVACKCMEGLLQSFKVADEAEQVRLCALDGPAAQSAGRKHDWKATGTLWWRGTLYDRLSDDYQTLLDRAFDALFEHSTTFREALAATGDVPLAHSFGKDDACETILTSSEFISRLERLRARARVG